MKTTSQIIIEGLIESSDFHKKVIPFFKSEYFEDPAEQVFFNHIVQYSQKYSRVPTVEALFIEISNDKKITENQAKGIDELITVLKSEKGNYDIQWLVDTAEQFCKNRALDIALTKSMEIIDGENKTLDKGAIPEILKEALSIEFDSSLGHDVFDDAEERWEYYHQKLERLPFNLHHFNEITCGGFAKKTLNLFLAGPHTGKSAMMVHQAAHNLADGKNVVYFTLEMSDKEITKRIDANLMGLPISDVTTISKDMFLKKVNILKSKHTGKLIVKEYPTGSANINHFRHFLNELKLKKGIVPDVVYVDYLNLCSSSRYTGGNHNSYTLMKAVSEELRGLAMELNICIVSATQLNRSGHTSTDPEVTDVSESFGIIFTADFIAALIVTDELKEQGKLLVKQMKNRYDDMNKIPSFFIDFNRTKMKFYDSKEAEQPVEVHTKKILKDGDFNVKKESFSKLNFT